MKIFIEKRTSKAGKVYTCFVVDLGYCEKILSFDSNVCAEILGVSARTLAEKPVGYKVDLTSLLGK